MVDTQDYPLAEDLRIETTERTPTSTMIIVPPITALKDGTSPMIKNTHTGFITGSINVMMDVPTAVNLRTP